MKMTKKNKTKKSLSENKVRNGKRARLEKIVAGLRKNRSGLKDKIRQQTHELKVKNGKLRNGIKQQMRSKEQTHIHTKAMESAVDGIFIIDAQKPNFPVIYSNRSFQKMTGYAKKEILGRDYFLLHGAGADPRIIEKIKNAIHHNKSFHGEVLSFQKDNKKYWNLLRITPVHDNSGAITHYTGIQTDVTLIQQRDLEIQEQREELLHVTRVGKLAEFVSSLAHEISQPLTAILSYAQAGQRMLGDRDPELQKILSYIADDDQRAGEVIRRLRSLLKKGKPVFELLDISTLINETIVLMATDATVRNSIIKTELGTDLPRILGDRIQLQQVLLNLISNSLDAMEDSKNSREILIRASRKDTNMIIVEVKDSGCGISEDNMKKIFKHFFTSKSDGLGMGLSISRSIIEAHGGRLEAKNNPGGGAIFYFIIPIAKKDAS
ncbi:MAG: ATP-binding protein [Candidatus Omnitrophota bacterium]|nr:ATP-binding protein [Candidatus Omnitrophota bacterium]